MNRETGLLLAAVGLIGWSIGGGRAYALSRRRESGTKPRYGEDRRLRRPDGTELHVETYGRKDDALILFIHGLGSDCDEWFEIRQRLADRHRLIDWDLAGLGESTPPRDGDWSLERAAGDLNAVLNETAGDRRVVLLGHSLGGMILLTFCRLFPETLRRRVAGLVLVHTTYTNPMKTNSAPGLALALQKPLVEPLCRLTIALSPLLWPVSVLDYLAGECIGRWPTACSPDTRAGRSWISWPATSWKTGRSRLCATRWRCSATRRRPRWTRSKRRR